MRDLQAGAHSGVSGPKLMSFDPLWRAACFTGSKLPWRQAEPNYWLNVVNFHSLTFRKTLTLPQPVTMIVIVVSAAACGSETAG